MNIEILEIAAKTISISGKEDGMEGARLVVAILTLVVTILIFVLERQHGKKEEFFTLYAKFIANENAQKACRIIENGDHQATLVQRQIFNPIGSISYVYERIALLGR